MLLRYHNSRSDRGFTLLEIIAVLGVITGLFLVVFSMSDTVGMKWQQYKDRQDMQMVMEALQQYHREHRSYPPVKRFGGERASQSAIRGYLPGTWRYSARSNETVAPSDRFAYSLTKSSVPDENYIGLSIRFLAPPLMDQDSRIKALVHYCHNVRRDCMFPHASGGAYPGVSGHVWLMQFSIVPPG